MMLICSKITPAAGKEGAGGKEGSRRRGELKAACLPACLPESASPCYRTTAKSTATLWLGWASPASRQRPASTHPPGVWKEARNATWRLRMRIASLTNRLGKPSAKRLHGWAGAWERWKLRLAACREGLARRWHWRAGPAAAARCSLLAAAASAPPASRWSAQAPPLPFPHALPVDLRQQLTPDWIPVHRPDPHTSPLRAVFPHSLPVYLCQLHCALAALHNAPRQLLAVGVVEEQAVALQVFRHLRQRGGRAGRGGGGGERRHAAGGRREREVARVAGAEEALDGCCPMQSLLERASKGQNLHYEGKQQGLQTQLARPAAAAAAAGARRPCALPRTACMSTLGAVIR